MNLYASSAAWWKCSSPDFSDSPKIEFCDPLFRRRFSQITRMTVHVVHELLEARPELRNSKLVFASLRGEISRQLSVNRTLIEENMILPATFSLSVFNTPIAAATIAMNLTGGYSVVFPSRGNFSFAVKAAAAPVLCGDEDSVVFAYADERIPAEYSGVEKSSPEPLAFALALTLRETAGAKKISLDSLAATPAEFLEQVL